MVSKTIIILFLCFFASSTRKTQTQIQTSDEQSPCENNRTYNKNTTMCQCSQNQIGRFCEFEASQMTESEHKILLSSNYSYLYFVPDSRSIFRLRFCFCSPEESVSVKISQERQNYLGEFQFNPLQSHKNFVKTIEKCLIFQSEIISPIAKKKNGQIPKMIIAVKRVEEWIEGEESGSEPSYLMVKYEIENYFKIDLIVNIVAFFLIFSLLFVIFALGLTLRHRYLASLEQRQQEIPISEQIEKQMPAKIYHQLIKELQENEKTAETDVCSICLCEFLPDDSIRVTKCNHIFHDECLYCWCIENFTCPFCRTDFSKKNANNEQFEVEMAEGGQNLRQHIL